MPVYNPPVVYANPSATAGPAAVNGTARKAIRSDGAPAVRIAAVAAPGLVAPDGTTITIDGSGNISASGGGGGTLELTDGTHDITAVTKISTTTLTVGGATPNATLDIPAASGTQAGAVTLDNVTIKLNGSSKINTSLGVNIVSTSSYTFQASDIGKLVQFTNTAGLNPSLPQAGTTGFQAGWYCFARFIGGGTNIITPTTSTIDGLGGYCVYLGGCVLLISDGTNYDCIPIIGFNAAPSSNTGYSLQRPDSTFRGGNNRGLQAVDLQLTRSNASNVASGGQSFCAGNDNRASGSFSVAIGDTNVASGNNGATAIGESNTASGQIATAIGEGNTAAGHFSVALGNSGTDNTNLGAFIIGYGGQGGSSAFPGRSQTHEQVLWFNTSGASAVRLTADGGAAGAHNVCSIAGNSSGLFTCDFIAINRNTGDILTYTFGPSLIANLSGTTTMGTGNPAAVAGPTSGTPAALGAVPTITADNTNSGFNISVTPPVGNVVNYVFYARIKMLENWWQ